ncbi:MAG: hypothetical protein JRD00_08010 [Deltaproteobacteria bacterium]|nr:hypothetical protein [Deltaproteobacteria bacterium]
MAETFQRLLNRITRGTGHDILDFCGRELVQINPECCDE